MCALLALASFDLGYPHAAHTHAQTALYCAEASGYTPLRVFIRWTQSTSPTTPAKPTTHSAAPTT